MTEAMPFLQNYDITFLRPPTIRRGYFFEISYCKNAKMWYHTCERRTLLDGGGSRR